MAVRFVPNPPGIALLAHTPRMGAAMLAWAEYVADIARSIAPRGEGEGGHYADQIEADGPVTNALGTGARVNANKFTSHFLEFGTSDTPRFATLRTAVDASGLTLGGKAGYRE